MLSSSTPYRAQRQNGVCYGTLWKQHSVVSIPPSFLSLLIEDGESTINNNNNNNANKTTNDSSDVSSSPARSKRMHQLEALLHKNERPKSHEFCFLVGNMFTSYENLTAFRRGNQPVSEVRIVGASAWNQKASQQISGSSNQSFRLVTNAGTHIYCTAPSNSDRDLWLAAFHAGLEITYAGFSETLGTLKSLCSSNDGDSSNLEDDVDSDTTNTTTTVAASTITIQPPKILMQSYHTDTLEQHILTPPPVNRGGSRFRRITVTSSPYIHFKTNPSSPLRTSQSETTLSNSSSSLVPTSNTSRSHCPSCGRYPSELYVGYCPLPQYGIENKVQVCNTCMIGQGVLRHVMTLNGLYVSDAHERVALRKAKDLFKGVLDDILDAIRHSSTTTTTTNADYSDGTTSITPPPPSSDTIHLPNLASYLEYIPTSQTLAQSLFKLIQSPEFAACRRRSRTISELCYLLEVEGMSRLADVLETLDDRAREAIASSTAMSKGQKIHMKKEALKVAGDMCAAIKMLYEYALPRSSIGDDLGIATEGEKQTEMLACILEYFLDLCDEGELSSIAFFWPQICQIHMQMLPPNDSETLVRVELVEDFLLTICCRYSVHLALELVWNCEADLEESLQSFNNASPSCRRRRFAILRFLCELESLLFDFEGGWGGGSISLNHMLNPSEHQSLLIREAMGILQMHRRFSSHHLTRSVRSEKLEAEAEMELKADLIKTSENKSDLLEDNHDSEESDIKAAKRKYKVARNAEYFSTQIMFLRRLTDIAESLRLMNVEDRVEALKSHLDDLNASGRLGGDPLNKLCEKEHGLVNVMHIPRNEGHVFRSKERTPVLLLLEIVRDESSIFDEEKESAKSHGEEIQTELVDEKVANVKNDPIDAETNDGKCSSNDCPNAQQNEVSSDIQDVNLKEVTPVDIPSEASCAKAAPSELHNSSIGSAPLTPKDHTKSKFLESPRSNTPSSGVLKSKNPESKENVASLVENVMLEQIKLSLPDLNLVEADSYDLSIGEDQEKAEIVKPIYDSQAIVISDNVDSIQDIAAASIVEDQEKAEIVEPTNDSQDIVISDNVDSIQDEAASITEIDVKCEETESYAEVDDNGYNQTTKNEPIPVLEESSADIQDFTNGVIKQDGSTLPNQTGESLDKESSDDNVGNSILMRKVSPFGSLRQSGAEAYNKQLTKRSLGAHGEGRRQVLTEIFVKGIRSSNLIARGVAPAARRAVQAMDRRRALQLMKKNNEHKLTNQSTDNVETNDTLYLPYDDDKKEEQNLEEELFSNPSESDECMESVRLLLIQNRVAIGDLTLENAALELGKQSIIESVGCSGLRHIHAKSKSSRKNDYPDIGEIDSRLAGCGRVSDAVYSALKLWKDGLVNNGELLDLIQKDLQFTRLALPGAKNESILIEDSNFWGRFAFGERWAEKKARLQASSAHGSLPGWDLTGIIVKSNDDLRQESFTMQLIELCAQAFEMAGLELWLQPYRILATGRTTGIIEIVRNAISFDGLKKRPGYTGGLLGHFKRMAECAADPEDAFRNAQKNFVRSLAAYSLLSYFFMFKDRHNGNILLDTAGHVIHIDFGFVFGIAPGGTFSLEQSVPFKLTEEMVEVMDGLASPAFSEFVTLFCCGFLALQAHTETFVTIVDITSEGSTFKCFEGKDKVEITTKMRERFCPNLNKEETIAYAMELIRQATQSYGTKQYDFFQYLSQGIAA